MAEADAQIEAEFQLTYEEVQLSRELDAYAVWQRSSWEEIEKKKQIQRKRAYDRSYYQKNRKKISEYKKKWYLENRASVLAQQKAYIAKRKELNHAREELQEAPPPVLDGHD
ncbi:hypothetical protein H7U37_08130 [Pseudoflavonifractor phocaeensis]|uniref:hypothetical protein n=1 Tax=Pseudoflavonifractor phocaeensis TaxID=1870988 RepID=UPI0019574D73|nr:hypothetical protein [Pseudoflavonifractor phocaeensis]MBM6938489.1 hypothetical protein [Pseudoflavonifractor phocaeensis]